jgi:hypothetical protein
MFRLIKGGIKKAYKNIVQAGHYNPHRLGTGEKDP